jgi:hypothetical protein
MKKAFMSVLLAVALIANIRFPAFAAQNALFDVKGHWAEQSIEKAITDGWVNGYPDKSFKPDGTITRAEFVKMLMAAIHLTPDSAAAQFLIASAASELSKETALLDMGSHWLSTQGWFLAAESFGLIVPSDYSAAKFEPDKAITRYEISVMADRALGLVYPAAKSSQAPDFSDAAQMPQWVRGYVNEAVTAGVLEGYPDGSFGGSRNATRAEAVVMVLRALQYMETGIDQEIQVSVRKPASVSDSATVEAKLAAPAAVIDGIVYVPVRSVFDAITAVYNYGGFRYCWNPTNQTLRFEYGQSYIFPRAGDNSYGGGFDDSWLFPAKTRMLYGELMVAAYSTDRSLMQNQNLWAADWNINTKTLTLTVGEVKRGE